MTERIPNPREPEREPRRRDLARKTKPELVQIYRDLQPYGWTAVPIGLWPKEEIIGHILRLEIGARMLCGVQDPETGLCCSIGADEIHGVHRYEITREAPERADSPGSDH